MELLKQYLCKIRFREDTAANWRLANPVLNSSEPGREIDTGLIKVGDGKTKWNELRPINESIKTINEPNADGKLYLRSKREGDISGEWIELPIQEAPNDGRLYSRNGLTKEWVIDNDKANQIIIDENTRLDLIDVYNLFLPEKDRKNINDLLSEEYDKEIDMGYTIKNHDGTENKVYGIRKYTTITEEVNKPHEFIIQASNIKNIINYGGTIATGKVDEIKALPCKEVELIISSKRLLAVSTIEYSERVLEPLDIWVMYTKEREI